MVKVRDGETDLVNLINLHGVDVLWRNRRDPPHVQRDVRLKYYLDRPVRRVWWATPDDGLGRPLPLPFAQGRDETGTFVECTVPRVDCWSLVLFDKRPR